MNNTLASYTSFSFLLIGILIAAGAVVFMVLRWTRKHPAPRDHKRLARGAAWFMAALAAVQLTIFLSGGSFEWTHLIIFGGAFAPALIFYMQSISRHTTLEEQANYAHDQRRCGRCEYDLTGNVSGVCPECGWRIPDAPVRLVDPDWTKWWKRWDIEYIDQWRSRLVSIVIGGIGFIALAVLVVVLSPRIWPVTLLMLALSAHMAIIAIRLYQYGRSMRAQDHDLRRGSP